MYIMGTYIPSERMHGYEGLLSGLVLVFVGMPDTVHNPFTVTSSARPSMLSMSVNEGLLED